MSDKDLPEPTPTPPGAKTAPTVPDKLLKDVDSSEAKSGQSPKTKKQPETAEADAGSDKDKETNDKTSQLDDAETDKAVDDIAANEADTMLAVQDAIGRKKSRSNEDPGWKDKLKKLLKNKWTWITLAGVLMILLIVPYTRYKLLGIFIKEPVSITVIDNKTATPVSNAQITVGDAAAKTNANGKATFRSRPGNTRLIVTKRYYKTSVSPFFVGLRSTNIAKIRLVATGRQVPVTVLNKITGKPLANAEIKALKTTAKTNSLGKAIIVLPANAATDKAAIHLNGYNDAKTTIQVTDSVVSGNSFSLTPVGRVYFLSNVSGTIDVVGASLDGSGRQVVLTGTDKEDSTAISLLASRDWRYLALKTKRDTGQPALYLIDTTNDKLTEFDGNNGSFNLIGWYGHSFMYDFVSNTVPQSQTGHEAVKSYDADHLQLNQLDQTLAEGPAGDYSYQDFYNFYVLNNQLVYNTQWYSGGNDLAGKNATIRAIQPNGQNKKDYQSFPSAGLSYVLAALYQPQAIYYDAYNGNNTYYTFANQAVDSAKIDQSALRKSYPTYLVSPSGNQTFWTQPSGGKDALFIGDASAQHPRQVSVPDGFRAYGWFSDNYLVVSKNGIELYIMPASGLRSGQQPVKISYYYKPVQAYGGYGYGYGGL